MLHVWILSNRCKPFLHRTHCTHKILFTREREVATRVTGYLPGSWSDSLKIICLCASLSADRTVELTPGLEESCVDNGASAYYTFLAAYIATPVGAKSSALHLEQNSLEPSNARSTQLYVMWGWPFHCLSVLFVTVLFVCVCSCVCLSWIQL